MLTAPDTVDEQVLARYARSLLGSGEFAFLIEDARTQVFVDWEREQDAAVREQLWSKLHGISGVVDTVRTFADRYEEPAE